MSLVSDTKIPKWSLAAAAVAAAIGLWLCLWSELGSDPMPSTSDPETPGSHTPAPTRRDSFVEARPERDAVTHGIAQRSLPLDRIASRLRGRVAAESPGGEGVAGAEIRPARLNTADSLAASLFQADGSWKSDANGDFTLPPIEADHRGNAFSNSVTLWISALGFDRRTVVVPVGTIDDVDIGEVVMTRRGVLRVNGRWEDGNPATGAQLFVIPLTGELKTTPNQPGVRAMLVARYGQCTTNAEGLADVTRPSATSTLWALLPNAEITSLRIDPHQSFATIVFRRCIQTRVICTVEGQPVIDARVQLRTDAVDVELQSDAEGAVLLPVAKSSRVAAIWHSPGDGARFAGEVELAGKPTHSITLLRAEPTLSLSWASPPQISDADRAVMLVSFSRSHRPLRVRTADVLAGGASFSPGSPGVQSVRAYSAALGFASAGPFDTTKALDSGIELAWSRTATKQLHIQVIDEDGQPIEAAAVALRGAAPGWPGDPYTLTLERRTDARGVVVIPAAPRALARLHVIAAGAGPTSLEVAADESAVMCRLGRGAGLSVDCQQVDRSIRSRTDVIVRDTGGLELQRRAALDRDRFDFTNVPGPGIEVSLELSIGKLRHDRGILDASLLEGLDRATCVVWTRSVAVRPMETTEVAVETNEVRLPRIADVHLTIAGDSHANCRWFMTRLATKGFASGVARGVAGSVGALDLTVGGLSEGWWVAELVDDRGDIRWWSCVEVQSRGAEQRLAASATAPSTDPQSIPIDSGEEVAAMSPDGYAIEWMRFPARPTALPVGTYAALPNRSKSAFTTRPIRTFAVDALGRVSPRQLDLRD
jgi:hypothetical protein